MARQFVTASSQYLTAASAAATAFPITMACWWYPDSVATQQVLMSLQDAAATNFMVLDFRGDVAGDIIRANTFGGGIPGIADSTAGVTVSVWNHACCVWAADNSRSAYCNGGNKGTDTTLMNVSGIDRTIIGAVEVSASFFVHANGRIADAAVWNVALTDAEVAALGIGFSPLLVRPQSLRAYWPLIGRTSPEIDVKGGLGMTLNNAPTAVEHPRIIMPRNRQSHHVTAAAGGAAIPAFMHNYRQRRI